MWLPLETTTDGWSCVPEEHLPFGLLRTIRSNPVFAPQKGHWQKRQFASA